MMPLADAVARDRIRHDLTTTLIVEAAAGTGKTTELVSRVLSLLRSGRAPLARIVAVTFTEKAAGEMKLRLRAEIEKARTRAEPSSPERQLLDKALEELEEARIGTIHGFCADLLRERAVEARVDPLFEVAAEDEHDRLYGESFERWFQAVLADPPEGVRRMLRRRSRDRDADGPRLALKRAGADLVEQRDFDAPWRRDSLDREARIDGAVSRLVKLGAYVTQADAKDDYLVQNLAHVRRFASELSAKEAVRDGVRDYDGLEAELRELTRGKVGKTWNWKGNSRGFRNAALRREVLEWRDACNREVTALCDALDADLAACLYAELWPVVHAYEALKQRAGKLDFLDLLLLTRNLLRDDRTVRNEVQQRFSHVLVDEFQDTDPLQADILMLLSADDPAENDPGAARPVPGKLFLVGDPKQSIYRFRRADVALYEATKRRLLARGAELVHLVTSFRSVPSIQQAVNAAFLPLMCGSPEGSQAEYVALMPFRDEPRDVPTVVALPVPRPYSDWGKIVKFRIQDTLPDAVGAFVDHLINKSGFTVSERERPDLRVPVQARHVCLLFKRFQQFGEDVTRAYVRALEVRHVPHVLVGGRSFHAREEVQAIRNALAAIEWPDDELSVFATLRGPFFAVGDDALLAFRHATREKYGGRLSPLARYEPGELDELTREVGDALAVLGRLHRGRNRRPISDTLTQLLEATRAHAGVAIWPTGEQALGNILRVLDLARRFESSGAISFRGFVSRLEEEALRGGAAEAPVVEDGTDGVRIMTVHKAKGLEFPVVILVDPTAPATSQRPSRYVDPERRLWAMPLAGCSPVELLERAEDVLRHDGEEAVRVAYVAATRAREMLVVPVVGDAIAGDEATSGWLDALLPVVFPRVGDRRNAQPAPGCPPFGQDSVRDRPESARRDAQGSVKPGLHRPERGDHRVVWWDPCALELDRQDDVGLRQQRILAADEQATAAPEGERLHRDWELRRERLLERGKAPSTVVVTVSQAKRSSSPDPERAVQVTVERTSAERRARPHGKRFGILVHAILASVPLDADPVAVAVTARAQGRLLAASREEIAAASESAILALAHPLLARAARALECRRESPVIAERNDGALLEGVLDLAFRERVGEQFEWTVVDFKSDVEIGARLADYERQVTLYADAVARTTGLPARGVLFIV